MAIIPRFISKTESTPAINNVRMDPSVAAAPYRAAEQSTAHLMNIFGSELAAWDKTIRTKQAEQAASDKKNQQIADKLYLAESMANLKIQSNAAFNEAMKTSDGTTNHANIVDSEYQKIVNGLVAGAPSDSARIELVKRAIGMRADLYNKSTNASIRANNQVNMDRMEGMLKNLETAAFRSPSEVSSIKNSAGDIFSSMKSLGIPDSQLSHIASRFNNSADHASLMGFAQNDPTFAQKLLNEGKYDHLGANTLKSLEGTIQSRLNTVTNDARKNISAEIDRLYAGLPLSANAADSVAKAKELGLAPEVQTMERLMRLSSDIGQTSPEELDALANKIRIEAASGKTAVKDPKELDMLTKFLTGNAEQIRKDPILYAQVKGNIPELDPIMDFSKLDDRQVEDRRLRAEQVKELYKVKAAILSGVEQDQAANMLKNSDGDVALATINNLNRLDQTSTSNIAKKIVKSDPALAGALLSNISEPALLKKVVSGRSMLQAGGVKRPQISEEAGLKIGELFPGNPEMQKAFLTTAQAAAAADGQSEVGTKELENYTGFTTISRPGWFSGKYSTVTPKSDMTESEFTGFLDKELVKPEAWSKYANGIPTSDGISTAIDFNNIEPSKIDYLYRDDGLYDVQYRGSPVVGPTGQKVRIDLKQLYKDTKE